MWALISNDPTNYSWSVCVFRSLYAHVTHKNTKKSCAQFTLTHGFISGTEFFIQHLMRNQNNLIILFYFITSNVTLLSFFHNLESLNNITCQSTGREPRFLPSHVLQSNILFHYIVPKYATFSAHWGRRVIVGMVVRVEPDFDFNEECSYNVKTLCDIRSDRKVKITLPKSGLYLPWDGRGGKLSLR